MSVAAKSFSVQFVSQAAAEPAYESFDFSPANDEDEKTSGEAGLDWAELDDALLGLEAAEDTGEEAPLDAGRDTEVSLDGFIGTQEPAAEGDSNEQDADGEDDAEGGEDTAVSGAAETVTSETDFWGLTTVMGTSGDDTLFIEGYNFSAGGGDGDDTVSTWASSGSFSGGNGYDTIQLLGSTNVYLMRGAADSYTLVGDQYLFVQGVEAIVLADGTRLELDTHAVAAGTDGDDELFADGEVTRIEGGQGHDTLFDYYGDETLMGGQGNDMLIGRWGSDTLMGGEGDDQLSGNETTRMDGGEGDDWLGAIGGELTGGNGADVFMIATQYPGQSVIRDFNAGEDRIVLNDGADWFVIAQKGADVTVANDVHTLTLQNVSLSALTDENLIFLS